VAPDGDLFLAIRSRRASVVTDTIECFTANGIRLRGGAELAADLVVVATGLEIQLLGGATLSVDGRPLDLATTMSYKGMMFSDVPNLLMAFGYTNASWTLKVDLTSEWLCRLLRYMERRAYRIAYPARDPRMRSRAFVSFTSGYVQRAHDVLPRQGTRAPWLVRDDYLADVIDIRWRRLADGIMTFERSPACDPRTASPSDDGPGR
jgi:cyclohexanone monooxygenase